MKRVLSCACTNERLKRGQFIYLPEVCLPEDCELEAEGIEAEAEESDEPEDPEEGDEEDDSEEDAVVVVLPDPERRYLEKSNAPFDEDAFCATSFSVSHESSFTIPISKSYPLCI